MLARLVRWLIRLFPLLSYDYRHSRIKRRQLCPACGNTVRVEIPLTRWRDRSSANAL